jgi:beta-aspartyl-peptidase (threonine type)
MNKIAIAVHGGAGPDSEFIQKNRDAYKKGLEEAANAGYKVLEDNPLFNSGRGSALNEKAEIEMDASIMNGKDLNSGAVAIVKNVKNPVTLARAIMEKTKHIYLGNMGSLEFAQHINLKIMPEAYFITDHAFQQYTKSQQKEKGNGLEKAGKYQADRKTHGTVGAVALDKEGNIAAATSSGGTENKAAGRIGDSSMVGVGSYANNKTCAVSGTGDGEYLIKNVIAFHLSSIVQYKGLPLKEACHYLIHEELKEEKGDMGIIAVDTKGTIAIEFNSERMHRAWKTSDGEQGVDIY